MCNICSIYFIFYLSEMLDDALADYDSSSVSRVSMSSAEHAPEIKTASIRQHHSTKRLSCIELGSGPSTIHNDSVSSGSSKPTIYMSPSELRIQKHHPKKKMAPTPMEKSKSTSNLADSDYASPIMQQGTGVVGYPSYVGSRKYSGGDSYHTVVNVGGSTDHGQHVYAVPVNGYASVPPGYSATLRRPTQPTNRDALVKSISIGGNHVLPTRPKSSPPVPPPDVVKINTNRQSVYADVAVDIQPKKEESPYESSFRPGTVAKLTNQPLVTTASLEQAKLRSHKRNASAASSQSDDSRRSGDSRHSADRPSVSFAEDKVFENASSYVQRHPNATLLVTADVHKTGKDKRESFEPMPDYDDDSDETDIKVTGGAHRKQSQGSNHSNISVGSQNKVHVMNNTQNRSSIQVNTEPPSKPAVTVISVGSDQRAPAVTLKTDIPKHRPPPPTSSGSESRQQGSSFYGVTRMSPTSSSESAMSIPPRPVEPAPSPPGRSYNAFNDQIRLAAEKRQQQEPSVIYPSRPAPPPPTSATPPPPPPPPSAGPAPPTPVPSTNQISSTIQISSDTQQMRPGAPAFSVQEIQAAAAERSARMEVRGPIEQQIPAPKPKNDTQAAILAAVAKRRSMLDQKTDTDVVDQIELRLNKTKKLQAAKFFTTESISQSRGAMTEMRDDESKTPQTSKNIESVKNSSHNTPTSPAETKKMESSTINPPSSAKSPPKLNVVINTPSAKASEVSPTSKQSEVVHTLLSKQSEKLSSSKPSDTPIVSSAKQSDFLALAEKARQEYLQKRASTSTLPRKTEAKASEQTPISPTAAKPVTVPASSSQKIFSSSMIPKNNHTTTINSVSSSTEQKQKSADQDNGNVAIKPLKDVDNDKETISSIRDKIAGFEKQKASLNGTVGNASGSYQVKGVTIDHSQTDTLTRKDKAKVYAMQNGTANDSFVFDGELPPPMVSPPPPPGFGDTSRDYNKRSPTSTDLVHIEIIPPPASFANMDNNNDDTNSSGEQYHPAFSHDDSVSLVSSLSTLSTLSSEHGEAGEKSTHRAGQGYDEIVAPPPPGFDDTAHVSNSYYEEINNDGFIPPPPEFGGNDKQNSSYVKSNKPFNSKTLDSWLCIDVLDWLVSLNLSQYKESFAQHCIDGKKLQTLVRNDFIELGVTQVGHRMNMERAIQKASLSKTHL